MRRAPYSPEMKELVEKLQAGIDLNSSDIGFAMSLFAGSIIGFTARQIDRGRALEKLRAPQNYDAKVSA